MYVVVNELQLNNTWCQNLGFVEQASVLRMAAFQIAPPEQFTFNQPDKWPKWICRFERFRDASRLSQKGEVHQVNALVYCMGDAADDILCSLGLSDDEKKVYEMVKTKLGSHFVKRRKVIFERCKFNQRKQEEGENVDSFITALHGLAEHCNYGALRSKMIRDRIVVGLLNANVWIKLQTDPELTFKKAITLVRQHESVIKQQEVVRGDQKQQNVDTVEFKRLEKEGANNHRAETNLPLQRKSHPDNHKNNFALGVAKHLQVGNNIALQGRQLTINVQKEVITSPCEKQANWHRLKHN